MSVRTLTPSYICKYFSQINLIEKKTFQSNQSFLVYFSVGGKSHPNSKLIFTVFSSGSFYFLHYIFNPCGMYFYIWCEIQFNSFLSPHHHLNNTSFPYWFGMPCLPYANYFLKLRFFSGSSLLSHLFCLIQWQYFYHFNLTLLFGSLE